uniref:CSN8/PSMD8/EIF3K domain-containing protein n=1 Tax=Monodelphis domestica TaxID=13616 RepID=A0A5F8GQ28_MONDO
QIQPWRLHTNVGKLLKSIDRVTAQILPKTLTNLPHMDFTVCKCLIDQAYQETQPITQILYLGDLLEACHFQAFWHVLENMDLLLLHGVTGFENSVQKHHYLGITYQQIGCWLLDQMLGDLSDRQLKIWGSKYGWSSSEAGPIFICDQEESIKSKNIMEKFNYVSPFIIISQKHSTLAYVGKK